MFLVTFGNHWREYASEAIGLGTFMFSACGFSVLLFNPMYFATYWNTETRFALMGIAMGITLLAIIFSPFGKLSGAHLNPSVTLTFLRLKKIARADALFFVFAQFLGGLLGTLISWIVFREKVATEEVNFAATIPSEQGALVSFGAEFAISFLMMATILITGNRARLARFTPFFAAILLAVCIAFEAPISGTSMNPARTLASAVFANAWNGWWIYFLAPPIGMLAAAEFYVRSKGLHEVFCAKLYHFGKLRCIFKCRFEEMIKT